MSYDVTVNGNTYTLPSVGEVDWSDGINGWIQAVSSGVGSTVINVQSSPYSALGNGIADDTTAIQAAINAAIAVPGGTVFFPAGTYLVSNTLTVTNAANVFLVGEGITTITYSPSAPTGRDVVRFTNAYRCRMYNIGVVGSTNAAVVNRALLSVRSDINTSITYGRSRNVFDSIALGNVGQYAQYGILIEAADDASNGNNDFNEFRNVICNIPASRAQCSIEMHQSVGNLFQNCHFVGVSPYGVTNCEPSAPVRTGGGVLWYGGASGSHTAADFYLVGGNGDTHVIESYNSEQSARAVAIAGPAGNNGSFVVRNVRYSSDSLHADGYWIQMKWAGTLTVDGCEYGYGSGAVPRVDTVGAYNSCVRFVGNTCTTPGSDAVNPVRYDPAANSSVIILGNSFLTAGFLVKGGYNTIDGPFALTNVLALKGTGTNLITSDTTAANASTTVGAFTLKPTATLGANDLVLDVQSGAAAHLLTVDLEGDTALGGNLTVAGGTTALTGTGTNLITSATSAANASTTVGAFTLKPTVTLDANDLVLDVQSAAAAHLLTLDLEGDAAFKSATLSQPSSTNAINMLDGARVNFSTGDSSAYLARTTNDTLGGPGSLDMGGTVYGRAGGFVGLKLLTTTTSGNVAVGMAPGAMLSFNDSSTNQNIKFDSTNILITTSGAVKTGSKLLTTSGLGVGNSAAASVAVGSLTKKIEIFDDTGASLGFIPVYSSIT